MFYNLSSQKCPHPVWPLYPPHGGSFLCYQPCTCVVFAPHMLTTVCLCSLRTEPNAQQIHLARISSLLLKNFYLKLFLIKSLCGTQTKSGLNSLTPPAELHRCIKSTEQGQENCAFEAAESCKWIFTARHSPALS